VVVFLSRLLFPFEELGDLLLELAQFGLFVD
jgi:hypothetical protein